MNLEQAAKEAGLNYRTAARWIEQGFILPHPQGYVGKQGNAIPLTAQECRELCILGHLRGILSFQALREAAVFLRKKGCNPYSKGDFIAVGGRPGKRRLVRISENKKEALELLGQAKGQLLLFVPAGSSRKEH